MPYITGEARHQLAKGRHMLSVGELNYMITRCMIEGREGDVYKTMQSYWEHGPKNYQRINDILGAYLGAQMEFTRRKGHGYYCDAVSQFYINYASPYEDVKIKENGDVYATGEQVSG